MEEVSAQEVNSNISGGIRMFSRTCGSGPSDFPGDTIKRMLTKDSRTLFLQGLRSSYCSEVLALSRLASRPTQPLLPVDEAEIVLDEPVLSVRNTRPAQESDVGFGSLEFDIHVCRSR